MNGFTKFFAGAAVALSMTGAAHATTFVQVATSGFAGPNQITWDGTAPGEGTLTVSNLMTIINFDDALFNDGIFGQQAVLTLQASTNGTGVLAQSLPNFTQAGLDGYFEFRSFSDPSVVLLRGDFTNFWLTGVTTDTSGNFTSVGGQLQLTSDVVDLSFLKGDNAVFGFTNVNPAYGITGGQLNDFIGSNLVGSFAGYVPEPSTWALMIGGFMGAGAMLRRRRAMGAFA
ncbi:PEPxxWA-CTERM sorting domain-containing protein [Phenylobacterium sp.]|uniref:PEPxxWA-CTERM sorting domain-containing protein n=1 Tax=Phenylobacterium sp. TaxID=1871053 RepID=UPI00301C247D